MLKKKTAKKDKDKDEDKDYDEEGKLRKKLFDQVKKNYELFTNLKKASDAAGYKVDDLIHGFEITDQKIKNTMKL